MKEEEEEEEEEEAQLRHNKRLLTRQTQRATHLFRSEYIQVIGFDVGSRRARCACPAPPPLASWLASPVPLVVVVATDRLAVRAAAFRGILRR